MNIKGYELVNEEKLDRAINGSVGRFGLLEGGVGENATDEEKLAAYDRLGGLILKDGRRVKTGSFFNFEKKVPRETPEVMLILSDLDGSTVEIPEGEALSPELLAKESIDKKKKAEKLAKVAEKEAKKAEKKSKKNTEEVEE